jgi:hypothetical protein
MITIVKSKLNYHYAGAILLYLKRSIKIRLWSIYFNPLKSSSMTKFL